MKLITEPRGANIFFLLQTGSVSYRYLKFGRSGLKNFALKAGFRYALVSLKAVFAVHTIRFIRVVITILVFCYFLSPVKYT